MKEEYKEISSELLQLVKGNAWSIENMDAHGAGDRLTTYIGSRKEVNEVFDYYKDNEGSFWYKRRVILPLGEIVSMEYFIFGRDIRKKHSYGFRKKQIKE